MFGWWYLRPRTRYGAYVNKGHHDAFLYPTSVYVDEGTMVDTGHREEVITESARHTPGGGVGWWCAGTRTGQSVIIEDNCFIGSRCIVRWKVYILKKEAVLGANVVITQSTRIIDVSGAGTGRNRGRVPAGSVVIRQLLCRSLSGRRSAVQ